MNAPLRPSTYPLGPALEFLQRVWSLNHALERMSGSMTRRLGVTSQQRFIIRCVGRYPGLTAGKLATLLHLDPGTISAALRRLESKGLVERRKASKDRRRSSLALTAEGRKLDVATPGTVESVVERLLSEEPEDTLEATQRVLQRLGDSLHAELSSSPTPETRGSPRSPGSRARSASSR